MPTLKRKNVPSVQAAVDSFIGTNYPQEMADATAAIHRFVGAPPRPVVPYGIKHNPVGWRWRLAKWLIGDELEVVPILPLRPIYAQETLLVKLGQEGALNTAEVKTFPMPEPTAEQVRHDPWKLLLTIEDPRKDLYPDTFVLLIIAGEPEGRVLGTFRGWQMDGSKRLAILETRHYGSFAIHMSDIKAAYYAPAGLQLEWLNGKPVGGSA